MKIRMSSALHKRHSNQRVFSRISNSFLISSFTIDLEYPSYEEMSRPREMCIIIHLHPILPSYLLNSFFSLVIFVDTNFPNL